MEKILEKISDILEHLLLWWLIALQVVLGITTQVAFVVGLIGFWSSFEWYATVAYVLIGGFVCILINYAIVESLRRGAKEYDDADYVGPYI